MRVTTFLICKFVEVHKNQLYIMGGGINEISLSKFPATVQLGIVTRIEALLTEKGKHQFKILFWDADGKTIAQGNGGFEITAKVKSINIGLNLPVPFHKPGYYSFEILIDEKNYGSWPFTANEDRKNKPESGGEYNV